MFNLDKIASVSIEYLGLSDLLQKKTSNPIAEEQIPQLLREVIKKGKPVYVTLGSDRIRLVLEGDNFKLIAQE